MNKLKKILKLHYVDQLSIRRIAVTLNVSRPTVSFYLVNGHEKFPTDGHEKFPTDGHEKFPTDGHENSPRTATEFPRYGHGIPQFV